MRAPASAKAAPPASPMNLLRFMTTTPPDCANDQSDLFRISNSDSQRPWRCWVPLDSASSSVLLGSLQSVYEVYDIVRRCLTMRHTCSDDLASFESRRGYPSPARREDTSDDQPDFARSSRRRDA